LCCNLFNGINDPEVAKNPAFLTGENFSIVIYMSDCRLFPSKGGQKTSAKKLPSKSQNKVMAAKRDIVKPSSQT
jgi:hypothetical protein